MELSDENLRAIAQSFSFEPAEKQLQQWQRHLQLLSKWNKVYNLTSITKPGEVLTHHFADSLSVARFVKGETVLDVGTGGGFPGVPLAVCFPQTKFHLVDTVQKKTRFLKQVVSELGLKNVSVHHARVEQLRLEEPAKQIISRAFSSLAEYIQLTRSLADDDTEWLAMKGKLPLKELEALPSEFAYTFIPLEVPGLDAERHLVRISRRHDD